MAAYVSTRQRTLLGLGSTLAFVPRRRRLSGLGDLFDTGAPGMVYIDMTTGQSYDYPCDNCGPGFLPGPLPVAAPPRPPFVYTDVRPIIPRPRVLPPVTAPDLGPGVRPVQVVFPSSATVPPPPGYAAAASSGSWLDQQLIAGVKNSYLALGTVGIVLFVSMSGAKRRR